MKISILKQRQDEFCGIKSAKRADCQDDATSNARVRIPKAHGRDLGDFVSILSRKLDASFDGRGSNRRLRRLGVHNDRSHGVGSASSR